MRPFVDNHAGTTADDVDDDDDDTQQQCDIKRMWQIACS